jgi:hypothetical protein
VLFITAVIAGFELAHGFAPHRLNAAKDTSSNSAAIVTIGD